MSDPLSELFRLTAEKDYVPTSEGLSVGSEGGDVERLHRYLQKFGYIAPTPQVGVASGISPTSGVFDGRTVEALGRFQQFNGLPVTGELDAASLELMSRPRCGLPDLSVAGFAVVGEKWDHTDLTYAYQNFTPDLTDSQISAAISQAFSLWAAVVPLTFTEVALGASPDIIIRFVAGAHGDGIDFDGPGGVYAHAFYPTVANGPLAGDAHFDEDETWSVDLPPTGVDLVSVAAHEFGHSLGLLHSDVTSALMYAFYSGAHRNLESDDVEGIQSIYGRRTTTLSSDDFSGTLVIGSGLWGESLPPPDWPDPAALPYNSGGTLHFVVPGPLLYSFTTSLGSINTFPFRCTRWTWNIADIPSASITAADTQNFHGAFSVNGRSGGFSWLMRYEPASVPSPGDAGTDTAIRLYPGGSVNTPPVADIIDGTPEVDFDIALHKYLRIVEECHVVTWQYSADGATWTDHYTYDLDPGYIYVDRFTGANDTAMTVGFSAFNFDDFHSTFEVQIESMLGETMDDCRCKPTGWYIGRVGSGGPF